MTRSLVSVPAGFIWWGAICQVVNATLMAIFPEQFDAETGGTHVVWLNALLVAFSCGYSICAGYLTAWIAGRREVLHAAILGVVNLAFGTFIQLQYWHAHPVLFHIIFLALLLPMAMVGGWLRGRLMPRERKV